jgi:hypothetical protein
MQVSDQPASRINARRRYRDLEAQRTALMTRLQGLDPGARTHLSYKRALLLINDIFRRSAIGQRPEILRAGDWLIGVLEQLTWNGQPPDDRGLGKIRRALPPGLKVQPKRLARGKLSRAR